MPYRWEVGQNCALRGIVNNHVWLAQSVTVVKDEPGETILLLRPGARCAYPEGYWRWKGNKDYSQGTRWQEAQNSPIIHREFAWHSNRLLMFLEPGKYYGCFMFWDQTSDQFTCYYINYQLPFQRCHCGFDTLDLDLDIVIDPQYRWEWKDEDDYRDGIQYGGIKAEWVEGIEQSQVEVLDRITNRRYPIDGSWLQWRPNPAWTIPTLPEDWQVV
jgi:hypothetical protein